MSRNQEPKNQDPNESKPKTRKGKFIKWGAGATAAVTLATGGVVYAATGGNKARTPNPNVTTVKPKTTSSPKPETSSTPNPAESYASQFEPYNTFAKELIDGKIPVRVLAATVTFSLSGQQDKYGVTTDKLLYQPSPDAIDSIASPGDPLYFTGSALGVAKFQGHDYLYGCDLTSKQNDRNKINPDHIFAGCLQRKWGEGGHENYVLFVQLDGDNHPGDLRFFTDGGGLNGQLYPGELYEPQSDVNRELIGPNFSDGVNSFEITYLHDPSRNNVLAESSKEIPISKVLDMIG